MKILLAQTSFIGDVVLSTPVIAALKRLYPEADLFALVKPQSAALLKRDPLLSGVISFDKRGEHAGAAGLWRFARKLRQVGFERAYVLHRSCRTALLMKLARVPRTTAFRQACFSFLYDRRVDRPSGEHEVMRNLALLSREADTRGLNTELRLFAPEEGEVSAEVRCALEGLKDYAVVVPGSVWHTKRWHWQGFREVARELLEQGRTPVLLGSPEERDLAERVAQGLPVINLAGRTSLDDALWVVKSAGLMVCNDSFALQLASAFRVPTAVVFCATSPSFGFGPWNNRAVVVEEEGARVQTLPPARRKRLSDQY